MSKIYPVVLHDGAQKDIPGGPFPGRKAEEAGYVNQAGLSRKVCAHYVIAKGVKLTVFLVACL